MKQKKDLNKLPFEELKKELESLEQRKETATTEDRQLYTTEANKLWR